MDAIRRIHVAGFLAIAFAIATVVGPSRVRAQYSHMSQDVPGSYDEANMALTYVALGTAALVMVILIVWVATREDENTKIHDQVTPDSVDTTWLLRENERTFDLASSFQSWIKPRRLEPRVLLQTSTGIAVRFSRSQAIFVEEDLLPMGMPRVYQDPRLPVQGLRFSSLRFLHLKLDSADYLKLGVIRERVNWQFTSDCQPRVDSGKKRLFAAAGK